MSVYTVSDVINRAARRLRILPGGEVLDNEDAADALAAYNSMMFGFAAAGLTLMDDAAIPVAYTHTIQASAAEFPLDDKYFDAVWQVLMEKLIGQFPIDGSVAASAAILISDGWSKLYGAFLDIAESDVSRAGLLPSQTDRWYR